MNPTLVLVHGAGANGAFWDEVRPWLSDVEVLAPSLPGRDGDARAAPTSAREAAEALLATLEAGGVQHALLVGHSYGGAVVLEAALSAHPCVAGLVLLATGARLRVHPLILETMALAVATGRAAPLARGLFRPETDAGIFERTAMRMATVPPAATLADWQAANAFDRLADLGRIAVPTCVATGTQDALTPPKYADFLARGISGAKRVTLEGGGHFFPVERAEQTAALLRETIDRASGQARHFSKVPTSLP